MQWLWNTARGFTSGCPWAWPGWDDESPGPRGVLGAQKLGGGNWVSFSPGLLQETCWRRGSQSGLWQRDTPSQAKMGLWGGALKSPKEELSSTSGDRDGGPAVTKKWPWEVLCVMIVFSRILLKK